MLTEYLSDAQWQQIVPGIHAANFSVQHPYGGFPSSLPIVLRPNYYEVIFCCEGSVLLGKKDAPPISIGPQEILILSSCSGIMSAQITAPIAGLCLSVDAAAAQGSFASLGSSLENPARYMPALESVLQQQAGCVRLHSSSWNRILFSALDGLDPSAKLSYAVMKCIEIFFLLCNQCPLLSEGSLPVGYLSNTVTDIQNYMENHLDEKLTIPAMSQRFNISPTAFKSCFRSMYGLPVHAWLQARRMQRAAEFLVASPMTVLQVAQAVGYDGVSQFNVVFKRSFGMTPSQYRKMSNPIYTKPIQ